MKKKKIGKPLVTDSLAKAMTGTRLTASSFDGRNALVFRDGDSSAPVEYGWTNGYIIARGDPPKGYGGVANWVLTLDTVVAVWKDLQDAYTISAGEHYRLRPAYRLAYRHRPRRFPHLGKTSQDFVAMKAGDSDDYVFLNSRAWWWLSRHAPRGFTGTRFVYVPSKHKYGPGVVAVVGGITRPCPWAFIMPVTIKDKEYVPPWWREHDFINNMWRLHNV